MRAVEAVLGGWVFQHRGVEAAVNEQHRSVADPSGGAGNMAKHLGFQGVIQLIDGCLHHRLDPHMVARKHPGQLEVVVAKHEQAAPLVHQIEHHPQGSGAVRTVVGQIPELHDEAVGGGGIRESGRVAVDIADELGS